jgi:adenine-specific DNA-methyltransferase
MKNALIHTARYLRKRQTPHEIKLWRVLRDRRLTGFKFRRQFPLGKYVADFCCYEARLIIELDGGQHNIPEHMTADREKSAFFSRHGFKVLRIWNNEIDHNFEGVIERIIQLPK